MATPSQSGAPTAPRSNRAYSLAKTAETLCISRTTLWRRINDGTIRAVQVSVGKKVVTQAEIDRILGTEAA
jgi:predicted site-specific integrase-resolvase